MEALGIQPVLLLAQLINVGILFFVLQKFLYKPILKMLDKRKAEIEEGLNLTQKMSKEEAKLKERQEELTSTAKKEAKAVLDEAKKQGEQEKKQIVADAHKQASEILAKAQKAAEAAKEQALESVTAEAVELASQMVVKLAPEVLSDADHHKLIALHVKDLQKTAKAK
jgi:F-type H+-transporting ATPase subunit b